MNASAVNPLWTEKADAGKNSHMIAIAEIAKIMLAYPDSTLHDGMHLMKVWSYARTIGCAEAIDEKTLYTLETAALLHDIACPLCRKKYGNTNGDHQEAEGRILAEELLSPLDIPSDIRERAVYLVSHHHTVNAIDGIDYQILIEADFIVNAEESHLPAEAIRTFYEKVFRTESGKEILSNLYLS